MEQPTGVSLREIFDTLAPIPDSIPREAICDSLRLYIAFGEQLHRMIRECPVLQAVGPHITSWEFGRLLYLFHELIDQVQPEHKEPTLEQIHEMGRLAKRVMSNEPPAQA